MSRFAPNFKGQGVSMTYRRPKKFRNYRNIKICIKWRSKPHLGRHVPCINIFCLENNYGAGGGRYQSFGSFAPKLSRGKGYYIFFSDHARIEILRGQGGILTFFRDHSITEILRGFVKSDTVPIYWHLSLGWKQIKIVQRIRCSKRKKQ